MPTVAAGTTTRQFVEARCACRIFSSDLLRHWFEHCLQDGPETAGFTREGRGQLRAAGGHKGVFRLNLCIQCLSLLYRAATQLVQHSFCGVSVQIQRRAGLQQQLAGDAAVDCA